MNTRRIFVAIALLCLFFTGLSQSIGKVDRRTKEFFVPPDLKFDYQVFGYQFPSATARKMICFSSHMGDVKDNFNRCPLGSYFDTNKMKVDDKILYAGQAGKFAKMIYVEGRGKKTMFYIDKSSFTFK